METCKICNESFDSTRGLVRHCGAKHNLNTKEYYDKFLKKENEGLCVVCGGETTFRNSNVGYLLNCSSKCRDKNKDLRKKRSEVLKGKKQPKSQIEKRIKNTNQKTKEQNRRKTMLDRYGVDNPTKMESVKKVLSVKHTGVKKPRSEEWQMNIIESKRKNGNIKHSEETKNKISNKLKEFL